MFMLIVAHEPMYNPSVWFEWPPRYFRWHWLAWLVGAASLVWFPYATNARIYSRQE